MENFLATLLYGHHDVLAELDERGPVELTKAVPFDDGAFDVKDPIGNFVRKTEMGLLAKREGVNDAGWDEPLAKAVELPPEFLERSNARLQKMSAAIDKVFGNYPEERQRAIEIARQALADARDEALAMA